MAESTLSLTRDNLRDAVGFYLGFGPASSAYTADNLVGCDKCIDIGLRSFYSPLPLPGETESYSWSFLTPFMDLPLYADQLDYDCPDDFAGLIGHKAYLSSDNTNWNDIRIVNTARIFSLRQGGPSVVSGPPTNIAIQAKKSDGVLPTRWQLLVWPTPDGDYTLKVQYQSNPFQLTGGQSYHLGGQPHSETIREACLAAAEREFDSEVGLHNANFMARLVSSGAIDRRLTGPNYLGPNLDRSGRRRFDQRTQWGSELVTYNGTQFE